MIHAGVKSRRILGYWREGTYLFYKLQKVYENTAISKIISQVSHKFSHLSVCLMVPSFFDIW